MSNAVSLGGVTKTFPGSGGGADGHVAVDDVALDVGENEFLVMVGPSGCGKSTLLRLIAGLEEATAGEIYIGQRRVDHIPPRDRNIGFMFQGYALFKHMTVHDNIAFGLRIQRVSATERRRRVEELVALMGLTGLEGRRPGELSGGQQQRVALARALAPRPQLLLLDEPFGAVDAKARQRLRADTKRLQRELQIPTILVTHDQREALELGDRVAVMNEGRFEQIDTPRVVYDSPATEFVARFIGRVNVFRTEPGKNFSRLMGGKEFQVMVRPEDIAIQLCDGYESSRTNEIPGTIVSSAFLGRTVRLEVELPHGRRIVVARPKHEVFANGLEPGKAVKVEFGPCQIFPVDREPSRNGNGAGP